MSRYLSNTVSRCLYEDENPSGTLYPKLNQDIRTDVCIIGGGFTGLTTALHLIGSGLNVCLIERHTIGYGASGRNSGQAIPGFNQDIRNLAQKYGQATAQKIFQSSIETIKDIKNNITTFSPKADFVEGLIIPALSEKMREDQLDYVEYLKNTCDYKIDIKSKEKTHYLIGSSTYNGSMEDRNTGRFSPRQYIADLASYCASKGIQIFENTSALKIEKISVGNVLITTEHAKIKAQKLVVAGDAYQQNLFPDLRKKFVLTKTYMIATEPLNNDLSKTILPYNHHAFEWRTLTNYYGKTKDNRLIFGGADSAIHTDEVKLLTSLRKNLVNIFPTLANTHISHFWGGQLAVTSNQTPEIDHIDHTIFYAYGYSGHGVAPSHMAGKILAQQIINKDAVNVMKDVKPLTIPGNGVFDNSIAKLALQWYKLKESFY